MKNAADSVRETIAWWRNLQKTIWADRLGSGKAREVAGCLAVSIVGRCTRENFVDLACHISQNCGPRDKKIILDFSKMRSYDSPGIRALIGHLTRAAAEWGTRISLVHAPLEAREVLKCWDTGKRIRTSVSAVHALDQLRQAEPESDPAVDRPYALIRRILVENHVAAF